jgi:hypothetical protein
MHPLHGKHVVYAYTEADNETESSYLVVFQVGEKLEYFWNPIGSYEPSEVPADLNERCVTYLKSKSIDELVAVHDQHFFDIDECGEGHILDNPNWWYQYQAICRDDRHAEFLEQSGIRVKHWMDGNYL